MKYNGKDFEKKFMLQWILANGTGWIFGFLSAFILSHFVVNLFYDKETNLIVGLCLGGSIGFAQWFTLKKWYNISRNWVLVSTLCLGIPVILIVLLNDFGQINTKILGDNELLERLLSGLIIGLLIGFFQIPFLKPFFNKASRWIIGSSIGWGFCSLALLLPMPFATFAVLIGGFILGTVTGLCIVWMSYSKS